MYTNNKLSKAVRLAIAFGAASATALTAQVAAADEQEAERVERIQVTGSRIPQSANVVTSSPITQVTSEEFEFAGTIRTEDLVSDLPQVFAGQAATTNNGANGTATISLRGLGSQRTLTLINGRRMVNGSPLASSPDLNQIPAQLIKNVELLTGGASATYGSDAISGVVNFMLKDDFEGIQFDYQHSFYQHNNSNSSSAAQAVRNAGFELPDGNVRDGHSNMYNLIMGFNSDDGKGNVTMFGSYRRIKPVFQSDRDFSACALTGGTVNGFGCGGSGTAPDPRFSDFDTFDFIVQGSEFVPNDGRLYNYGPVNYFQRPDERVALGAFGKYAFNNNVELYAEVGYTHNNSVSQIAESGAFFVPVSLGCSNPLMSAQQFNALCGDRGLTADDSVDLFVAKRNIEGGPRINDLEHNSHRAVLGLRGEINDQWTYDVYFNVAQVNFSETYFNDFSKSRLAKALDVVTDANGNAVCRSATDGTDPGCVPYNLFTEGAIDQAQIDYLTLPLFSRGTTGLTEFTGYVLGDLTDYGIKSPFAEYGAELLLGVSTRRDSLSFAPDRGFIDFEGAGQGGPTLPVSGSVSVDEIFSEAKIYLVEDAPFAESLVLDLGFRYSEYDTGKTTTTQKYALGWDITEDFKLRASYQIAARAANIRELFAPQGAGLFQWNADPCGGENPQRSLADCQRTGVTADRYGSIPNSPANQYNDLRGGNPDLDPEESKTKSVGFVFRPTFIDGFDFSVDYFDIKVEKAIGTIPAITAVNNCLDTGDDLFCSLVQRAPGNQSLWLDGGRVITTNVNIGFLQRTGIDVNSMYTMNLNDMGRMRFSLTGTYFQKFDNQPVAGGTLNECAGKWGGVCDPVPKWQHNFRATWMTPWDVTISANWRHLGKVDNHPSRAANPENHSSENYLDLTVQWMVGEGTRLSVGINNVLDNDPPYYSAALSANTDPGFWDSTGRYVFFGIQQRF